MPAISLRTCYAMPAISLHTCYVMPAISLRTCYAMPGTTSPYCPTHLLRDIWYLTMSIWYLTISVQHSPIVLRTCYAMSGTHTYLYYLSPASTHLPRDPRRKKPDPFAQSPDVVAMAKYEAHAQLVYAEEKVGSLLPAYALPTRCPRMLIRACYAMSGTDVVYAATRRRGLRTGHAVHRLRFATALGPRP
eukprot:1891867-Rhodomonas_salina.1